MNPKDLKKKMETCISEMDGLQAKIAKLQEAETPDADEVKKAEDAYKAKVAEFDELKGKVEQLREKAERIKAVKEVEDLAGRSAASTTLPDEPAREPAQAHDEVARQLAKAKAFYKYLRGSSKDPSPDFVLSGEERKLLEPVAKSLREGEAAGSVSVPVHLVHRIL